MATQNNTQQSGHTLVIDQGTHASRLALFDTTGRLMHLSTAQISTQTNDGQIEQDAGEILQSITSLLHQVADKHRARLRSAGLCTQRSTIVAWDTETGEALSPAISWRDLRGQNTIDSLREKQQRIHQLSGLPLSAHYSASKIHWLLKHNNRVQQALTQNTLCIAPLASYLLFHLLEEAPIVLDHSNAQRSQLLDIHTLNWSVELLRLFDIPENLLPELCPVQYSFGHLNILNTPLKAVCGDQNAAVFAFPPLTENDCMINIGTGAFLLSPEAESSTTHRLLRTIASTRCDTAVYLTEGTVNGAGAAISWQLKQNEFSNSLSEAELFDKLPGWLSEVTEPPLFINTVAGLGSPWWCNAQSPEFISSIAISPKEKYVAIIESIVFLLQHNLQQLRTMPKVIYIGGGLSQLDGLCQKLSNISLASVLRSEMSEISAYGCFHLAQANSADFQYAQIDAGSANQFKPQKDTLLIKRYHHFVGELQKRCNSN